MTAGQDGPDQQGWQQPPQGPPAYPGPGQSPYGQSPQGYGPAPAAPPGWGAPPPQPMPRPETVRIGIGAFVATLVLGVISAVVQLTDTDQIVELLREQDAALTEEQADALATFGVVIVLITVALQAMFIWFAWAGRNWARIVLFVLGGLTIVSGLAGLAGASAATSSGFLTSMAVFQWLLTVVGVVALALRPSSEWYRHEGWRRSVTR
ncbi:MULTISPECIES: hypothetical protein [unclassified Blastococcus]